MNTVIKGTKTIAEYKRVREDMENLARANYARHEKKNERNCKKALNDIRSCCWSMWRTYDYYSDLRRRGKSGRTDRV